MTDALEDHEGTVSIGGRTITNLSFADDIDGLAREEEELTKLVELLDDAAYGMEISAQKTKLMKNNNIETKVNGQKLKAITSLSYLCSFITVGGLQARDILQDSIGNSSFVKEQTSLE